MKKATHQQTKQHNRDLVLRTIFANESISRAEVARVTNLTRTTVSDVVNGLLSEGLVQEVGRGESLGGKSPILLSIVPDSRYLIGLNLGQDKFIGAIVNLRGEIKELVEVPVHDGNGKNALEFVYQIIDQLLKKKIKPIVGIGVGTPGLVNTREGIVVNAVNLEWQDLPLGQLLEKKYKIPVSVLNDSQATAIGEFVYGGEHANDENLIVVNVKHGIGSGILLNGRLFQGDGGGAGEIGHVVVQENGELCRCGKQGCLETISSTRAVLKELKMDSLEKAQSAFDSGNANAKKTISRAAHYLGISLANLIGTLNIKKIVLTGDMTRFGNEWLNAVNMSMRNAALARLSENTTIELGTLDYRACILGASAFLLLDDYSLLFREEKLMSMHLIQPRIQPPADEDFRPAVLANQNFRREVDAEGTRFIIGLERGGEFSRFEVKIYPENHAKFESNYQYVERIVKFLLWQRGGHTIYVSGSKKVADYIRKVYSPTGERKFDYHFMGKQVYEKDFTVIFCDEEQIPASYETGKLLGRNLQGHRIGFDLGASDRKVSAVIDGTPIFSEEVIWEPRKHVDPEYHYQEIMQSLKTAASKLPRVDAIGGSSAGIYINNRPMVASLFRGIPEERFDEIRNMFLRIRDEMGVPLEVINDGDVTALAGSMSIEDNGILGIALGSSEAAGYVNRDGQVMGWLNELAFAPIDYSSTAPIEEWSGDQGCGASYFSQQCVFRLAPKVGIELPIDVTDAEKLKFVQEKLETSHEGATKIWQSMGIYLGYGIAHYADFYDIKHVLILGRCTSGRGGDLLLEGIRQVFEIEFPELLQKIEIHLPNEKLRRVGQSIAAASLPVIEQERI